MSKVSFSFAPKPKPVGDAPSLRAPAAFASIEDDTTQDSLSQPAANKKLVASTPRVTSKRKRQDDTDAAIYQYDEVWDSMKDAEKKAKEIKHEETKERKPKYIGSLLNSAATRKLDHLRAEEKMIQREREAEGDEFADKDRFVTQAYKDQLAEMRKAEEEEKLREEQERKKGRGKSTGMTHFYRELLDRASEQHSATVAATASPTPVAGPSMPTAHNLTIVKPPTLTHSDIELARLARSEGKDVELNDDNQIVDKRDLLSAGLNLSAPNTRRLGIGSSSSKQRREGDAVPVHQAAGAASSRKEIRERQLKLLEQQLAEEEERLARDHEKAVQEELGRVVAKRNGEEELKSARQRYLERKQQSSTQEPASVGPP